MTVDFYVLVWPYSLLRMWVTEHTLQGRRETISWVYNLQASLCFPANSYQRFVTAGRKKGRAATTMAEGGQKAPGWAAAIRWRDMNIRGSRVNEWRRRKARKVREDTWAEKWINVTPTRPCSDGVFAWCKYSSITNGEGRWGARNLAYVWQKLQIFWINALNPLPRLLVYIEGKEIIYSWNGSLGFCSVHLSFY